MAAEALSTAAPNAQSKNTVNDSCVDRETFRINGCTPLIAESHDYYRQAHAVASFASTACDGEMTPNDHIVRGVFEAIEQLVSHGIYQQEQEERQSSDMLMQRRRH